MEKSERHSATTDEAPGGDDSFALLARALALPWTAGAADAANAA